ncbi:hypothetical protein HKD37_13G035441 [Glycine soja]
MVTTLQRLGSTFPLLLLLMCFLYGFRLLDYFSLQPCMAIYRKQPRSARKFAQASCSSQANCGLMVKASTFPGELLA